MDKKLFLLAMFGIFAFVILMTNAGASGYYPNDYIYGHKYGYIDGPMQYSYNHGYGYDGYSDTYYKKSIYTPYGKTIIIKKESPFKSYYGHTTYNYGYGYYPQYNKLYDYFKGPYYGGYHYPNYGCYGYYC